MPLTTAEGGGGEVATAARGIYAPRIHGPIDFSRRVERIYAEPIQFCIGIITIGRPYMVDTT